MTLGQKSEDILSNNRSLIFQYLQRNGICTRAQLSKSLSLTPASITKTVAGLMDSGLVEETGFMMGEKGRRSIGIALKGDMLRVIGVKLSRRNYAVGMFDLTGNEICSRADVFGEEEEITDILANIKKDINDFIERYDNIVAIGMAVPGPYFEKKGGMMLVTDTKGWNEINLQKYFKDEFHIPMIIRHDGNSVAMAEWWQGSRVRTPQETVISFLVAEGVGAGVIIGGEILSGANGIATEIGHVSLDVNGPRCDCGNYGCLELYCSSLNVVKQAKAMLPTNPDSTLKRYAKLNYHAIFEAAKAGDELAHSLVKKVGRYIGYGAVTLINAYDPSAIFISGDMVGGGDVMLQEVIKVVQERVSEHIHKNIIIEISNLKGEPILRGAAAVAIDYCLQRPEHLLGYLKNNGLAKGRNKAGA